MTIAEVMTENVEIVSPDTTLDEVARKMRAIDCGSIPVAENDRLVGMITDRDIVIRCVAEACDPATTMAKDIMSRGIRYCYADEDVEHVLENMGEQTIRRLPVLNRSKELVGIVSLGDLAAACDDEAQAGKTLERIRLAA